MTRAAGRDWAEWTSLLDGARASGQRDAPDEQTAERMKVHQGERLDALQAAASRLDG